MLCSYYWCLFYMGLFVLFGGWCVFDVVLIMVLLVSLGGFFCGVGGWGRMGGLGVGMPCSVGFLVLL